MIVVKIFVYVLTIFIVSQSLSAQIPGTLNYQGMLTDADGNINVNNSASTVVPFESKNFDIGNIHNPAINNTRLVASIDGIYHISAMVTWLSNSNGIRQISIRRNNVVRMGDTRTAAGITSQSLSGMLQLNKDDFVDLLVFQDSGTTLQLISGAPIKFEMFWVAPAP
jgi:hypothetical protein